PTGASGQGDVIVRSRPEPAACEALLGLAEPGPAVNARRTAAARTGRLRAEATDRDRLPHDRGHDPRGRGGRARTSPGRAPTAHRHPRRPVATGTCRGTYQVP